MELKARVVLASTVFDTYFAGQLGLLNSIAASPAVVATDQAAMRIYFKRLEGGQAKPFTGGLGWIDREGVSRVSSNRPNGAPPLSVADRSYFKAVVATGGPFVSEGLVARTANRRVVIMAVPTRDSAGRLTGVLAGALELKPSPTDQRSIDLGFAGLVILDRAGQQVTLASFARPDERRHPLPDQDREGVLTDVRGLDGSSGRVVAYANSKAPGWTTVIDRPASTVFAPARRGLFLELVVIGAAALAVLCIIGWALCARDASRRRSGSRSGTGTSSRSPSETPPPRARSRLRSEPLFDGIPACPGDRRRARGRALGLDGLDVRAPRCRPACERRPVRRCDRSSRLRGDRSCRAHGSRSRAGPRPVDHGAAAGRRARSTGCRSEPRRVARPAR